MICRLVRHAVTPLLRQTLTGPDFAFSQSHTHTDVKLLLGFLACGIALGSTGWVYYHGIGWEESKELLRLAVGA